MKTHLKRGWRFEDVCPLTTTAEWDSASAAGGASQWAMNEPIKGAVDWNKTSSLSPGEWVWWQTHWLLPEMGPGEIIETDKFYMGYAWWKTRYLVRFAGGTKWIFAELVTAKIDGKKNAMSILPNENRSVCGEIR